MYKGILGRVLLPVLLVLLLVAGSSAYYSYSVSKQAVENTLRAELSAISRLLARNINTLMDTAEGEMFDFMQRDFMQLALNHPTPDAIMVANEHLKNFIERFPIFDSLLVASAEGRVLMSTSAEGPGANIGDRDYFKAAAAGEITFSPPVISRFTNVPVIHIAIPILENGQLKAVVAVSIPLSTLNKKMIEGVSIGKTGYPYIVASNGVVVAHPDPAQINTLQLTEHDWGRRIMSIEKGFTTYTFNGTERTAASMIDERSGMRVAVVMQTSEFGERVRGVLHGSVITLVAIMGLVSLVLFLIIRNIVSKPLQKLSTVADQVANGNLNVDLAGMANSFNNKGEITTTYQSINAMLVALKDNIYLAEQKTQDAAKQAELAKLATAEAEKAQKRAEQARSEGMHAAASDLEGSIAIISSASEELSAQVEHSGKGAEEQAARVADTATAMEEMNATVMEVAKSATIAEGISNDTKHKAQEGAQIVHDVVESIHNVQAQSMTLKDDMETLVALAQSIDQIMGVISDIADQTNLLALNAAIEAARAGEAGRGFAVVADEVRKLAEKTMTSTGDVGNAIKSIQQATNKNMERVDSAVRTIEAATVLADKSGVVLKEIVGLADQTADHIHSIATASEEQSASSDEISRSISQVSVIATQTSSAMQEAAQAVGDLASQAQSLQTLVNDMKNS